MIGILSITRFYGLLFNSFSKVKNYNNSQNYGSKKRLSSSWAIDIEVKLSDDPEIWDVQTLVLDFDVPVSKNEAYWKFERIMANDDNAKPDYVGTFTYGPAPARNYGNARVNLDASITHYESNFIAGVPGGNPNIFDPDDQLISNTKWPSSVTMTKSRTNGKTYSKFDWQIMHKYDITPDELDAMKRLVGVPTHGKRNSGYQAYSLGDEKHGRKKEVRSAASLKEWYNARRVQVRNSDGLTIEGERLFNSGRNPVEEFYRAFSSPEEANRFFNKKVLHIFDLLFTPATLLSSLSTASSPLSGINYISDSVDQYNATVYDDDEITLVETEMNMSLWGYFMDDLELGKFDTSGMDEIEALKYMMLEVLNYKWAQIANDIASEAKSRLIADVIDVPHPFSSSINATSVYQNSRQNVTVFRSSQTSFNIGGNSYAFELIFDKDFLSIWVYNGTEYIKRDLFLDGTWNPNLFLSSYEMSLDSQSIQDIINEGKIPRYDFNDRTNDLHLLTSSFYLYSLKIQQLSFNIMADPEVSAVYDFLEEILFSLPDISIDNIIKEYRRIERESIISNFADVITDRSKAIESNITVSDFFLGLENALMMDGFSSASPWQQSTASQGLIYQIEGKRWVNMLDFDTKYIRDRVYSNDVGEILLSHSTPINRRFSDYYDTYDIAEYSASVINILSTKSQPFTIDESTSAGTLMARIESIYGNGRNPVSSPATVQTSLLNLYSLYKNEYDKMGLVSDKAGLLGMFMSGHDQPVKFQFDWRFVEWGIRPNKGRIPLLTQWTFDILLKLNLANPYDMILFEFMIQRL